MWSPGTAWFLTKGVLGCAGGFLSLADLEAQHDPTLELSHLIRNQRSAAVLC